MAGSRADSSTADRLGRSVVAGRVGRAQPLPAARREPPSAYNPPMRQYAPDPDSTGGTDDTPPALRCHFCGRTTTWGAAVEGGWTPDFYFADGSCSTDPACPGCTVRFLVRGADGEYQVRV